MSVLAAFTALYVLVHPSEGNGLTEAQRSSIRLYYMILVAAGFLATIPRIQLPAAAVLAVSMPHAWVNTVEADQENYPSALFRALAFFAVLTTIIAVLLAIHLRPALKRNLPMLGVAIPAAACGIAGALVYEIGWDYRAVAAVVMAATLFAVGLLRNLPVQITAIVAWLLQTSLLAVYQYV